MYVEIFEISRVCWLKFGLNKCLFMEELERFMFNKIVMLVNSGSLFIIVIK